MRQPHPSEQRLEPRILAHRIELDGGRDQNQGTVAFFEGAVQAVEEALEIRETQMNQGQPHRGYIVVRGAHRDLLKMLLRPVEVSRTAIRVAEDADVVNRSAAQLDRPVELRECPVVLPLFRARITERVVRKGEGRLQCQNFFELLDRTIDVVMEMVDVADLRLHLEVQRVQSLGLFQLGEGLVVPPFEEREPPCIPEMPRRRAGTELEGTGERLLRSLSIPVVVHGDKGAYLVSIGQRGLELEGFLDGPSRLRHRIGGRKYSQPGVQPDVTLRKGGVSGREAGIPGDGFAEISDGPPHRVI